MSDLLDIVDDLTLPKPVKVQTDYGHTWATEDALLVQLEDAVHSSIGAGSGGSSAPWEKNLLDSAAIHEAAKITSMIGDWCRIVGAKVTRNATTDLRAWHAKFLTSNEPDEFYITKMTKWAALIRTILNPPRSVEITAPCPECGKHEYTNDTGETVRNPLVLTYRPDTGSIWQDAKAQCRACNETWETEWRLRALRHDIDSHENNPT